MSWSVLGAVAAAEVVRLMVHIDLFTRICFVLS
jgi:hypothetical protein